MLGRKASGQMDSADAAQEVQLRALKNRPHFPDRARRRGWMRTVLRNVIAGEGRRQQIVDFGSSVPDPVDGESSPSSVAALREESGYVLTLLHVLPERDRRVVELRVLEGRPFAEVAAAVGLNNEAHARVIFQRSLERLRSGRHGRGSNG